MADRLAETASKGPDQRSPTSHGSGAASKRRRRALSHGNPEKTPCINCGRVPHRKCEHHLCPRCCNVVVKNCPVHIRKSDIKRGAHATSTLDTPRNLTEVVEVYHNEMESVRQHYRWMFERKRIADEAELKQSIKRYKETTEWLAELISPDPPFKIVKKNKEMEKEIKAESEEVMEKYGDLLREKAKSLPQLEFRESPSENGKCHAKPKEEEEEKEEEPSSTSRTPQLSITPVSLPESEWLYMLQRTAKKPSIQLRPT